MTIKPPVLLKYSKWVHERGTDPSRIVLRKFFKPNGAIKEYVTHMEVKHPWYAKPAYYSGHYFTFLADAKKDFELRKMNL